MTITFISNTFNHHERFLCEELFLHEDVEFYFIQTSPLSKERTNLGWSIDLNKFPFCVCAYDNPKRCEDLVNNSDILIIGSAPHDMFKKRLSTNKISFFYCESFFKQGFWHILNPKTFITILKYYVIPSRNPKVNMLCASAFTAYDCTRIFAFRNRCYRWGHFIEVDHKRNPNIFMQEKRKRNISLGYIKILWVGRLIELKHPEMAIMLAQKLKQRSIPFKIDIIGIGPLEKKIKELIANFNLYDEVKMQGSLSPKEVRDEMEKSDIFIFTSNHKEGWGAVLGEAMASGCAVVAGSQIGATPFLIENGKNGLIYDKCNYKSFEKQVIELINNDEKRINIGIEAIRTMQNIWSPKIAAHRFYNFSKSLLNNSKLPTYTIGPMSIAPSIKRDWFK